jgi:hypothetical protein
MDPFNEVVEPNGLLKYVVGSKSINFSLQLPDLKKWRRDNMGIEVRMVRLSCTKMHQVWPTSLEFNANGTDIFEVKPPEEGHKRRDVPLNITSSLKCGRNEIRVRLKDTHVKDFALALVLTRPRGIQDFRVQVSHCDFESAKNRLRVLLDHQERSKDIMCLTSNKLSLKCPLSIDRVSEPTRGVHCQHLQCFGFEAFVMSNVSMKAFNNRWQCPVCSMVIRPANLCFDDYVANVLVSANPDVDEVTVVGNGSWMSTTGTPEAGQHSSCSSALSIDTEVKCEEQVAVAAAVPSAPAGCLKTTKRATSTTRSRWKRLCTAANRAVDSEEGVTASGSHVVSIDVDDG